MRPLLYVPTDTSIYFVGRTLATKGRLLHTAQVGRIQAFTHNHHRHVDSADVMHFTYYYHGHILLALLYRYVLLIDALKGGIQ
jgi:hypothetical protein